jgi:predicted Fe-Mo cluster-binding NifX family protein
MKIAIPTIGSLLDELLVHCEVFTLFSVDENNNIYHSEIFCTPQGCDCKCNIPYLLQQKGVTVMLAGKIGDNECELLKQHNIKVVKGYSGNINIVIYSFLNGLKKNHDVA